jgi:cytochrome c556
MRRHAWMLPFAVILALGACCLTVARARDDADDKAKVEAAKKAASDVEKLADAVAAGDADALKKQADAVVKKYDDLGPIMWQMKPREKGGLGVGAKPGAIDPDASELQLIRMGGKKGPNAADLKTNKADYQRMVEVVRGIAEPAAAPSYGAKYAKPGDKTATKEKWISLSKDMQKGSDDLIDAIKTGNPKKVQDAANRLNANCNDCHTIFRDN